MAIDSYGKADSAQSETQPADAHTDDDAQDFAIIKDIRRHGFEFTEISRNISLLREKYSSRDLARILGVSDMFISELTDVIGSFSTLDDPGSQEESVDDYGLVHTMNERVNEIICSITGKKITDLNRISIHISKGLTWSEKLAEESHSHMLDTAKRMTDEELTSMINDIAGCAIFFGYAGQLSPKFINVKNLAVITNGYLDTLYCEYQSRKRSKKN